MLRGVHLHGEEADSAQDREADAHVREQTEAQAARRRRLARAELAHRRRLFDSHVCVLFDLQSSLLRTVSRFRFRHAHDTDQFKTNQAVTSLLHYRPLFPLLI